MPLPCSVLENKIFVVLKACTSEYFHHVFNLSFLALCAVRAVVLDSENPPRRGGLPVAMIVLLVHTMRFPMRQVSISLTVELSTFPQCSTMCKKMEKFCERTVEI